MQRMSSIPKEEQAKGMQAWMDWAKKVGNQLVDLGSPLTGGLELDPDGKSKPSTDEVCGYSVLQAENMDEAKKLLQGHPHLSGWDAGCSIEVHESMPIPGM